MWPFAKCCQIRSIQTFCELYQHWNEHLNLHSLNLFVFFVCCLLWAFRCMSLFLSFSPLISAICQHFNPLFYYHHPSSSFSPFFYLVNPVGLFSCAPFFFLSYHQPLFLFSSLSIFLAFYLPDVRQEKETGSASVIGQRRQRPQPRLTSWVDVTNMI